MSVAFDAASTTQTYSGVSSKSWTHTNVGTTNLCGSVGVGTVILTANFSSPTCTWGGAAMTASVSHEGVGFNLVRGEAKRFHKANPATGAQTVAVTWATGSAFGESGSQTYTGVDQATPLGNTATADGTGTDNGSPTVASATGNMVVDDLITDNGTNFLVGGQTERFNQSAGVTYNGGGQEATGAASVTMGWSWTGSDQWTWCGCELVAAGGAAATPWAHRFARMIGPGALQG